MVLFLSGCLGGPKELPEIKLEGPRRLVGEGRARDATLAFVSIYVHPDLASRNDSIARQARAEILMELYELGAHRTVASAPQDTDLKSSAAKLPLLEDASGRRLLTAATEGFSHVLATSVEPRRHVTCSDRLAEILRLKLSSPPLRQVDFSDHAYDQALYRRLLAEGIADFELFALARHAAPGGGGGARPEDRASRASSALEDLATRCFELAGLPTTLPAAAEYWKGRAERARSDALAVRTRPSQFRLSPDLREFVESDVEAQLKLATLAHDGAVRRYTGREDPSLVMEGFEDSLRHAIFARESLLKPTQRQMDVLNTAKLDLDRLKRLTQRGP